MDVKLKLIDWGRNTCSLKILRVVISVQLLSPPTSKVSLEPVDHLLAARRLLCMTEDVISDALISMKSNTRA